MNPLKNNQGVALILTILVVSLIIAFTLQFNRTMRAHLISSVTNKDDLKALYAAKSGVSCALALLKTDDTPEVTTLFELKLAAGGEDKSVADICAELTNGATGTDEGDEADFGNEEQDDRGDNGESLSAGSLGRFTPLENCEFEIIDESGKIQLNALPAMEKGLGQEAKQPVDVEGLLTRYFEQFSLGKDTEIGSDSVSEVVYAILNWIDRDENNRGVGWDYSEDKSKNGPLYSLDELHLIEGLDQEALSELSETAAEFSDELGELAQMASMGPNELFEQLTAHLSVFSANDGKININTASEEVILSLHEDMDEQQFDYMQQYRCGDAPDSTALTSTDWYHKGAQLPDEIEIPEDLITTKSDLFRIVSTGRSGDVTKRVVAVAKRKSSKKNIQGGSDFRIVSWTVE